MYWFLPWVWTVSFLEGLFGGQEVVAAPLSEGDIDAAAEIHSQAFDQAWTGDELAAILAQDGTFGVVARRIGLPDDPPLGFVLARNTEGEAEILTIAVAKREPELTESFYVSVGRYWRPRLRVTITAAGYERRF